MWLATEIWRSQEAGDVAIKLTPAGGGRLEVNLDGEKIFDVKEEGGVHPNLSKANELKMVIADRVFEVEEAIAAGN